MGCWQVLRWCVGGFGALPSVLSLWVPRVACVCGLTETERKTLPVSSRPAAAAHLSALGRTLVVEASPKAGQGAFLFPRSEIDSAVFDCCVTEPVLSFASFGSIE